MAINIYIQPTAELYYAGNDREFVAHFEDEGCHLYLCNLFQKVGEKVDDEINLWRGVIFYGSTLEALHNILISTRESLESQPETWTEYAGLSGLGNSSPQEEVHVVIDRKETTEMVHTMQVAIQRVLESGAYLAIYGD